jgi:superfamily II DNA/RNA helicase
MLFSATMPGQIVALARRYMTQPTHIRASDPTSDSSTVDAIEQHVWRCHQMDKPELVARVLQAEGRGLTMIFCRTKRVAGNLAEDLANRGFASAAVHGDLGQGAREQALRAFRSGKVDVLVATDVAARGIDVADVTHVINYECPDDEKTYLHRVGRTGRAGASGDAWSLCSDKDVRLLADIEKLIRKKLTPVELVGFEGRSARQADDKNHSERSAHSELSDRRPSDRGDRTASDRPRSASVPAPRREKIDPWFLKPYEPSEPAQAQTEPVLSKNSKTTPPVRRAALLGGGGNKT